jgi:hypothetical protein
MSNALARAARLFIAQPFWTGLSENDGHQDAGQSCGSHGARDDRACSEREGCPRRFAYIEIKNEPAPKLIVDQPLPEGLANGLFWAQYRVENVHIQQVFGEGALKVSPRVGHLHIQVDDSPFLWADASDINTIDVAFFTPGQHKVKIDLVDPNHNVFPGQSVTLTFNILKAAGGTAPAQPHGPPK